jgi:hypothetical protein
LTFSFQKSGAYSSTVQGTNTVTSYNTTLKRVGKSAFNDATASGLLFGSLASIYLANFGTDYGTSISITRN